MHLERRTVDITGCLSSIHLPFQCFTQIFICVCTPPQIAQVVQRKLTPSLGIAVGPGLLKPVSVFQCLQSLISSVVQSGLFFGILVQRGALSQEVWTKILSAPTAIGSHPTTMRNSNRLKLTSQEAKQMERNWSLILLSYSKSCPTFGHPDKWVYKSFSLCLKLVQVFYYL